MHQKIDFVWTLRSQSLDLWGPMLLLHMRFQLTPRSMTLTYCKFVFSQILVPTMAKRMKIVSGRIIAH